MMAEYEAFGVEGFCFLVASPAAYSLASPNTAVGDV